MANRSRSRPPPVELDLHGMNAERARSALLSVIDRHGGRAGLEIRVIHGFGDGVLRECVEQVAAADPRIASARRDEANGGVTHLTVSASRGPRSAGTIRYSLDLDAPGPRRRKRR